jgi:all-trans-retinol 13,14-reductase
MAREREDADVLVVGAGAGGLATAAYLAAYGRRVVVIDRGSVAGGNTSVFTHGGYEFDIGLHYLGGFRDGRPGMRVLLEPLGIDLRFREQDPDGFDTLLFEDMTFEVPKGLEAFRARLKDTFPAERTAIDRYLRRIAAVGDQTDLSMPVRGVGGLRDVLAYTWRARNLIPASRVTLRHELDRLGISPRMRLVLSWLHGVYAVAPSRVSLAMHAAATMFYLRGSWYPEGGASAISQALANVIVHNGGEILLDTEVSRILTTGGTVQGVVLEPGPGGTEPGSRQLRAPVVVSAVDIKRTFLEMLDPGVVPSRLRRRVERFSMALPLFIVYAILDRDLRAEGMPNRNWSVIDCDNLDGLYASLENNRLPSQTWMWITSANLKDPTNERLCRPGQTNLQLMRRARLARVLGRGGGFLSAVSATRNVSGRCATGSSDRPNGRSPGSPTPSSTRRAPRRSRSSATCAPPAARLTGSPAHPRSWASDGQVRARRSTACS